MGNIKLTLFGATLNRLNQRLTEFEKKRNLGGILRIIALKAISTGDSIEKVADTLRVSEECVRNWIHAFLTSGVDSLSFTPSPGRPKILKTQEKKRLIKT